jgi:hypothetical protein
MSGPGAEILLSGADDWVSLAEARSLVRESLPPSATAGEVRSETLSVVADLLRRGLMEAGQLQPRFVAWDGAADAVVRRIASGWPERGGIGVGEVCWLASTADGKSLALRIAEPS